MQSQKIDQLERSVTGMKDDIISFKEGVTEALKDVAGAISKLAIATSESKFRDENLKSYVQQNHEYVVKEQEAFANTLAEIKREQGINKTHVNDIKTQQALNNRSIADARKIFLGVIASVLSAGLLIWLGLK